MGYLRVGPQYYPPRPLGAQVIQRGPHGYSFSEDPIKKRLRTGRGTGFVWWSEQMDAAGDQKGFWQPQQAVNAVMGLGLLPDNWTCPVRNRAELEAAIVQLETDNANPNATHEEIRAKAEGLRECHARFGDQTQNRSQLERINRVHRSSIANRGGQTSDGKPRISPSAINPSTGEIIQRDPNMAYRMLLEKGTAVRGDCAFWDLECRAKGAAKGSSVWVKIAVGGMVVLALLSFSRGAGESLFRRRPKR